MSTENIKSEESIAEFAIGVDNTDPYKIFKDIFSKTSVKYYRKYISSILKAAYSDKCWHKSNSNHQKSFQSQIEQLILATHAFTEDSRNKIDPKKHTIINDNSNEIEFSYLIGLNRDYSIWEVFPRNLSKREFRNPYRVFDKFFKFNSPQEWIMIIRTLISYAQSNNGSESVLEFDFLKTNRYLQKLIESAHLIYLRDIRSSRINHLCLPECKI